jgi:hypothetical protein
LKGSFEIRNLRADCSPSGSNRSSGTTNFLKLTNGYDIGINRPTRTKDETAILNPGVDSPRSKAQEVFARCPPIIGLVAIAYHNVRLQKSLQHPLPGFAHQVEEVKHGDVCIMLEVIRVAYRFTEPLNPDS